MNSNQLQIAEIVRKLLAVPDKLLPAQLCLRPLRHGDPIAAHTETIQPIADACDLMHSALGDVVEVARTLADMSGIDASAPVSHRVSLDSYYRRGP